MKVGNCAAFISFSQIVFVACVILGLTWKNDSFSSVPQECFSFDNLANIEVKDLRSLGLFRL